MRDQAIETGKLTAETVKQGKTLMVFTVATIIFVSLHLFMLVKPSTDLPLSLFFFMETVWAYANHAAPAVLHVRLFHHRHPPVCP